MRWRVKDVLIVTVAMLVVAGLYWLATHQEEGCTPKAPCGITQRPN